MRKRLETPAEAIAFVKNEETRMQRLIDGVRAKMKIGSPIQAVPNVEGLMEVALFGGHPNIGITRHKVTNKIGILYTPGISLDTIPEDEMLSAMIAHEVGHYMNGDVVKGKQELSNTQSREHEYAADKVAYQFGYGPGLIAAFEQIGAKFGVGQETSSTHPALSDRIRRLRAYDDEGREVAA